MEIGLVAAFLGGALALLSPCGALLLPAFFAGTVGGRGRLTAHGLLFLLGLLVVLVPLGLGAAALGGMLVRHRDVLVVAAGAIIIVLGVAQVFGKGVDLARLVPGARRLQAAAPGAPPALRSFLLGTVSGVAGFCAGPILGAVLTLAATETVLVAGTMLAVYGAGMVLPLLLVAALWTRLGDRGRARLRGRELAVGPLRLHSTSIVTGVVLVVVGAIFLRTRGMATLPELVPAHVLADVQGALSRLTAAVPDVVAVVVAAVLALAVWGLRQRRARVAEPRTTTADAAGREAHAPVPHAPAAHLPLWDPDKRTGQNTPDDAGERSTVDN